MDLLQPDYCFSGPLIDINNLNNTYGTEVTPGEHIFNGNGIATIDKGKVHELTYVIENTIIPMPKDLFTIAANLEEVPLASIRLDQGAIEKFESQNLKDTDILLATNACVVR